MTSKVKLTIRRSDVFFFLLAFLLCTYARVSLLIVYPLLVAVCFIYFKWKIQQTGILVLLLMLAFWLFSFRNGIFLKFNLVSFYFYLTFVVLLFASPGNQFTKEEYLRGWITALTCVALINNVFGIIQYIRNPGDDSFVGIYGRFTVSQNGLSLVNGILAFLHFLFFQQSKRKVSLVLAIFFLICSVMGFYGAGIIALLASVVLFYLRITLRNILRLIIVAGLSLLLVYYLMKFISPDTLEYNIAILKRFASPSVERMPRKLIIFKNYGEAYFNNWKDFVFGSGPGTFNSRSAFMVGSPTYFNLNIIKSDVQPHHFSNYAYTLWNASNTGPYDGFMNQPFSSFLALLGEYGLLITLIIFWSMYRMLKKVGPVQIRYSSAGWKNLAAPAIRFLLILTFFLILIDNYIEYPEIIFLILFTIKLAYMDLAKRNNTSYRPIVAHQISENSN
jgi:hypothetical protein